eukprot:TRINITY_DN14915_c0_g1_i1.p2 TRINITY_DN14915_c0_g1~~TRINITY_DN14915_c0_g1_i1.p2  ORF type:complete len:97 (-),score=15.06 TRINITY_DN14915_c0_g1_i1:239-529(-)
MALEEIDVCFCKRVQAHFVDAVQKFGIRVIRLKPWMVGSWECHGHPHMPENETHHYFGDGSFKFERDVVNNGYVIAMEKHLDKSGEEWVQSIFLLS